MSDEERGELVHKDAKPGVRRAVGDSISVFQGACSKLGMCGAVLCTILFSLVLGLALPVAAMVIGIMYKDDCHADWHIPLYLIVAGAGGLLSNMMGTFCRPAKDDDSTPAWRKRVAESAGCCVKFMTFMNSLLGLFLFIWFLLGNVWVFKAYDDRHNCNHIAYWFAFITIAISDGVIALLLVGGIIACFCFCCCALCKG